VSETYVITFHVKPDQRERFRALLDPVLDAMRHEETFVHAALHVDAERPYVFQLHETWTDRQDVLEIQLQPISRRMARGAGRSADAASRHPDVATVAGRPVNVSKGTNGKFIPDREQAVRLAW
jgi:quinol monooxygenase YgiN